MLINTVIDNFSILAEKKKFNSILNNYFYIGFYCGSPFPSWEEFGISWEEHPNHQNHRRVLPPSEAKIKELDRYLYDVGRVEPPQLSMEEINEVFLDYPYKLPLEFCQLYQRGNGCLPIGIGDKV